MPIYDWPLEDRPREKLLLKGAANLTNTELIAIFLASGIRGHSAIDIARALLVQYGTLQKLFAAPKQDLLQHIKGLGPAKYASLQAAVELGRRYWHEQQISGEQLNDVQKVQGFLTYHLANRQYEVFACLFLTNRLHLITYEEIFFGTVNEIAIYPREIVRRSLLHNAVNIILVHNHPSGCPTPSLADQDVTALIKQAAEMVEVNVVDHLIIGKQGYFSFAKAGLL